MPEHRIEPGSHGEDAPIPLEPGDHGSPPEPRRPVPDPTRAVPARGAPDPGAKCPKCGYSIIGLTSPRCPECGVNLERAIAHEQRTGTAKRQLRAEYLTALGLVGMSMAAVAGLLALYGDFSSFPFYLLEYAISVPIGLAVYWVCCVIWIGFDQPWGITALKLAAIYAIADAIYLVFAWMAIPFVPWAFAMFAYVGLLAKYLDLDYQDAMGVAVATVVARFLLAAVLYANFA